jgi:hypothetical protein
MDDRARAVAACFLGCVISSLLGLYLLLEFKSPWPPMFFAVLLPALASWRTGAVGVSFVVILVVSAFAGWMFGYHSIPDRVRSLQGVAASWHGENDRFVAAMTMCTIFVVLTACVARLSRTSK